MIYFEECSKTGNVVKKSCKKLPSGRFRLIDGQWFRVGDSRAVPDEPFANKGIDWDNGVLNHADGKHYTNKQSYIDGLKAKGCKILGEDAKVENKKDFKDVHNIDWRKEVAKTINNLSSSTTKKGKRK